MDLSFSGTAASADLVLTYGTTTDGNYGSAREITSIGGTFSDAKLGLTDIPVIGLVKVNHATPEPGNLLAPADFSRFAVANGLPPEGNGFLTFDNLYWPGGSPATATSYPAAGGVFDIYGVMFRIGNGRVVDLWSNGIFGPPGSAPIDYGVAVATVDQTLDYVPGGLSLPVPEPGMGALLLSGLGLLGFMRGRRGRRRSRS